MAELYMTALADAILVIGIALTALLFAFGVRRLLDLQPLLLRTLSPESSLICSSP
jgi:hypothetical protein